MDNDRFTGARIETLISPQGWEFHVAAALVGMLSMPIIPGLGYLGVSTHADDSPFWSMYLKPFQKKYLELFHKSYPTQGEGQGLCVVSERTRDYKRLISRDILHPDPMFLPLLYF